MSERRADLILAASVHLKKAGVDDPGREARRLMRWAARLDGAGLAAAIDDPVGQDEKTRFAIGLARRAAREPLSHITGQRAFWSRDFIVTPDVLDPRPETEVLVGEALHRGPFGRVLDIGTGSGVILVTLLAEWERATGVGTDCSEAALKVAVRNAICHRLAPRAEFVCTQWIKGVEGQFDLVVSNPPYIPSADVAALSSEVQHEPVLALTPGSDGLEAYRVIARDTPRIMAPGALLMVEIGADQSNEVAAILANAGFIVRALLPDLDQRPRVLVAQR